MRAILTLVAVCALVPACRDAENKPPLAANVPVGSASAPAFARAEAAEPAAPAPAPEQAAPEEEPAKEAAAEGEGEGEGEADEAAPNAEASDAPLPIVQIKNVGLHIGGEDNTADQKKPIRTAVMAKYDEMRRCYGKADDPPKTATFSVDMRIPREGGKASVSHPRSGLKGGDVKECLVAVFESVEFSKQPKGPRMVSFSLEFKR